MQVIFYSWCPALQCGNQGLLAIQRGIDWPFALNLVSSRLRVASDVDMGHVYRVNNCPDGLLAPATLWYRILYIYSTFDHPNTSLDTIANRSPSANDASISPQKVRSSQPLRCHMQPGFTPSQKPHRYTTPHGFQS